MRTTLRTLTAVVLAGGVLTLGAGVASATPDDNFQPGPDYDNFQPGPDYDNFQPGPDYDNFQPGAAPGTADLVDDTVAGLLRGLGLFG